MALLLYTKKSDLLMIYLLMSAIMKAFLHLIWFVKLTK